jgi:PST family polysaccharide transporter
VFDSAHRGKDLAKKSVRGGATTLAAQGVQFGLSLVNTMILARLLTPGDFGLIGMVVAITGFAEMFKNAGLSMATINKDHISHEQISALFWLNLAISLILGLCLLVGSPLVAMFYGRPELTAVTAVLSISFIISGLVIQHQALLNRHMMFSQLAILTVLLQLISMGVSIVFACLGWRYWALVAGMFVSTLVSVFLTYFFCPWMPGWIRKNSGAGRMLTFGGQLTAGNVSNYISMNMDNVLVGKYLGDVALGLYAKAYGLFLMPIVQFRNPMLNVAMPVLCALRDQPDRYAKYYLRIVNILATLVIPAAMYCVIEADFLIRFFLGPQWIGAVGAFRILAVAGIIFPFKGVQALLMVSMGYSTRWMYLEILYSVFYVISFVAVWN